MAFVVFPETLALYSSSRVLWNEVVTLKPLWQIARRSVKKVKKVLTLKKLKAGHSTECITHAGRLFDRLADINSPDITPRSVARPDETPMT